MDADAILKIARGKFNLFNIIGLRQLRTQESIELLTLLIARFTGINPERTIER